MMADGKDHSGLQLGPPSLNAGILRTGKAGLKAMGKPREADL